MSVISVKAELEMIRYFDVDGNVVINIYQRGYEEPCFTDSFSVFELAKEFVDIASGSDGVISDPDAVEATYEIIDELQDVIDYLNDSIDDPEGDD